MRYCQRSCLKTAQSNRFNLVSQPQIAIIGKKIIERDFAMAVPTRSQISIGCEVNIVLKQDQRTGQLTQGVVSRVLTKSPNHPHH